MKKHYTNNTDAKTTYIQPSNLVPHFWNYTIVDKEGSPDLPCIMILAELFNWFRNLPNFKPAFESDTKLPTIIDGKLALSYDFLILKLNFQRERIRRNLVKLEKLNILTREFINIPTSNGNRTNKLLIVFNPDFYDSCFRDADTDNRVVDTVNISYDESEPTPTQNNPTPHQRECPISKNKSLKKDRSMRSNFISNSSEDSDLKLESNNSFPSKPKTLIDFYPLNEKDCQKLQSLSGRSFSLNAMNEILKDMSKRLKDNVFYSRKGFYAYMAKAFSYEMRNENLVSNAGFRINANYSEDENNIIKQEKYLTQIESSLEVSPEWHLKKKLASVLEREKAYNILSKYKRSKREGSIYKIYMSEEIELGIMDKEIILNQVNATQGRLVNQGEIEYIEKVEFIYDKINKAKGRKAEENRSEKLANITDVQEIKALPLLQKIRRYLMNYQNSKKVAVGLDQAWFSKLELEETINKEIKIKAPNDSYKDYITINYMDKMEKIIESIGYSFLTIET